mmetsp:Transcript_8395/g.15466  ORF Transcript_8395/g.15466 Transcript_8395/m.15466 type:complete len:140 (-) Transcript_8395:737-1156(-)
MCMPMLVVIGFFLLEGIQKSSKGRLLFSVFMLNNFASRSSDARRSRNKRSSCVYFLWLDFLLIQPWVIQGLDCCRAFLWISIHQSSDKVDSYSNIHGGESNYSSLKIFNLADHAKIVPSGLMSSQAGLGKTSFPSVTRS